MESLVPLPQAPILSVPSPSFKAFIEQHGDLLKQYTPSGTGLQVVLATKRCAPKEVVAHAPKRFFLFFPLMPLINCSD